MKVICYISSFANNLNKDDINSLIKSVNLYNKEKNITGVLIIRNKSFFQILEGNIIDIDTLYAKIIEDKRHIGLLKISENEIEDRIFNSYNSGEFDTIDNYSSSKKLLKYFNWIRNADHPVIEEIITLTKNYILHNK